MIQVAQNGDRPRGAHPALPITLEELVADAAASLEAGAASVHLSATTGRRRAVPRR